MLSKRLLKVTLLPVDESAGAEPPREGHSGAVLFLPALSISFGYYRGIRSFHAV